MTSDDMRQLLLLLGPVVDAAVQRATTQVVAQVARTVAQDARTAAPANPCAGPLPAVSASPFDADGGCGRIDQPARTPDSASVLPDLTTLRATITALQTAVTALQAAVTDVRTAATGTSPDPPPQTSPDLHARSATRAAATRAATTRAATTRSAGPRGRPALHPRSTPRSRSEVDTRPAVEYLRDRRQSTSRVTTQELAGVLRAHQPELTARAAEAGAVQLLTEQGWTRHRGVQDRAAGAARGFKQMRFWRCPDDDTRPAVDYLRDRKRITTQELAGVLRAHQPELTARAAEMSAARLLAEQGWLRHRGTKGTSHDGVNADDTSHERFKQVRFWLRPEVVRSDVSLAALMTDARVAQVIDDILAEIADQGHRAVSATRIYMAVKDLFPGRKFVRGSVEQLMLSRGWERRQVSGPAGRLIVYTNVPRTDRDDDDRRER